MKAKCILRLLFLTILLSSAIGSADAQILIKDFNPGPNSSTLGFSGKIGDKLFFTATDPNPELFVSDRSTGSINMIGPELPGVDVAVTFNSLFLVFRDSLLVFTTRSNYDMNFYTTNGSLEGTHYFKTIKQGVSVIYEFVRFKNKFYFPGWDAQHGTEVWESDGTELGTQHLLDPITGKPANSPVNFKSYNDRLWFSSYGRPWYIDASSIHLADNYYPNSNSSLEFFTNIDSEPAFFIQPFNNGLYKRLVKVNPDASLQVLDTTLHKNTILLAYKNQKLLYSELNTDVSLYTRKIKSLDASTGDTTLLISFSGTNINSNGYTAWIPGNNKVFLSLSKGAQPIDFWATDGTPAGTVKIDILAGASSGNVYFLTDPENGGFIGASGNIFLNVRNGEDVNLWISDGSPSGTERIEIEGQPLSNIGTATFLHYANGYIFNASHPLYGTELFYSDGTNAGTKLLADLVPGTKSPSLNPLTIHRDTLFMGANLSADYGFELYALPIDLCKDIACPDGFECIYGKCVAVDPCANVACPVGQVCYQGGCYEDCTTENCVDLGPNLAAEHSATLILDAGSGFNIYEWSTGDTTQTILVDKSGSYWVIAYNTVNQIYSSDTISVIFKCNPQGDCPQGFGCIDGYCINTDWCRDVTCQSGDVCWEGGCYPSCTGNTTLDLCYHGQEFNYAPCDDVVCAVGQVCHEGGCYEACLDGTCVDLGPNLAAGHNATLILDAGSGFNIYEWSTGDTTQTVLVDKSGRYWVIAYNTENQIYSSDTISVIFECNPQGDCPQGFECIDGYCINTDWCRDVQCPSGDVCYEGGCYPSCTGNPTLDLCFLGQEFNYAPCDDVVCPQGDVCYEGGCYPTDACADVECPAGEVCYEGGCYPSYTCEGVNCNEGDACYLGSCFQVISDNGGAIAIHGNIAEEKAGKKSVSSISPRENINIALFNKAMTGYYASAVSNSEGNFEFSKLGARTYKVFIDSYPYEIRGSDSITLTNDIPQNNLQITLVDGAWEIVLNGFTGIEDKIASPLGLRIYPNPAHNSLFTTSTVNLGRVELYIYNAMGGKVHNNKLDINAGEKILLHEFRSNQKGIYFVQIMKEGKILYNGRVVVIGD